MLKTLLPAAAVLAVLTFAAPAPAQDLAEVKLISFPGSTNWPVWAAQERGEFAKNGMRITLTHTPNSVFLMLDPAIGLQRKGELDIAGLHTVLALRSEYGQPQKKLSDPAKYYDSSYYNKALNR